MKWKGIKKAVGDTKCCPNFWRIYADLSRGQVWCNSYVSENDWTQYHSKSIKQIACGYGDYSIFGQTKITMAELSCHLIDSLFEEAEAVTIVKRF